MKVLIIEDELLVADIIEEVLILDGFEVCGIARGITEALTLAEQHNPDIAVVDVHLIDGYGTDLAPILMQRYHAGIIYTTANIDAVLTATGHACLQKPFRLSMIKQAIDLAYRRRAEATPMPILMTENLDSPSYQM